VVAPRPYIPSWLAIRPNWQAYASIPFYQVVGGIEVYRPAYLVIPGVMQSFWSNEIASYMVRPLIRKLHSKLRFDAILSFDLSEGGGVAWRVGRDLGLPTAGWATGDDIRSIHDSPDGRRVAQTLRNLDLVLYQSRELMAIGSRLLRVSPEELQQSGRHHVLPRGVILPKPSSKHSGRTQVRTALSITDEEVMILYVGRIVNDKGLFGLIDVLAKNADRIKRWKLVFLGANRAFDQTEDFEAHVHRYPELCDRVQVLPACEPEAIWEYLEAADIFAFPSMKEGMPNALLEAMISGLPAVAFDIPAISDLLHYNSKALVAVESFNYQKFFDGLMLLSEDQALRESVGNRGKKLIQESFSMPQNMRVAIHSLMSMAKSRTAAV
jgi:teichuronic acid biosynthesis glycosyltransferase TuaC